MTSGADNTTALTAGSSAAATLVNSAGLTVRLAAVDNALATTLALIAISALANVTDDSATLATAATGDMPAFSSGFVYCCHHSGLGCYYCRSYSGLLRHSCCATTMLAT